MVQREVCLAAADPLAGVKAALGDVGLGDIAVSQTLLV